MLIFYSYKQYNFTEWITYALSIYKIDLNGSKINSDIAIQQ